MSSEDTSLAPRRQATGFLRALPSLVTLSALSCGVSAIRSAFLGHFEWSVLFLCLAAVFDGLDGHVARLLNAVTEMGAELDSLCDLVDFGVAPCLVVYAWLAHQPPSSDIPDIFVWSACLIFVCCCAYRLARFNLTDSHAPKAMVEPLDETDTVVPPKKDTLRQRIGRSVVLNVSKTTASKKGMELIRLYITKKKFFQGVPAPMAGGLALTPMVWSFFFKSAPFNQPHLTVIATFLVIGVLMVSTVPTLSSKMLMQNPRKESHLASRSVASLVLKVGFVISMLFVIVYFPWYLYLFVSIVYVALLPFGPVVYHLSE